MKFIPTLSAKHLASLLLATSLAACATTQAPAPTNYPGRQGPQQPVPGPQTPDTKTPGTQDPKKPDVKDPKKPDEPDTPEPIVRKDGLTPPHMSGRDIKRVALVLPFSAKSSRLREEAGSMLKAAEMAVFDREDADVLLIALDSAGTTDGARAATQAAIKSGADVVLGPLLARNVEAASRAARRSRTPVIAFSTDQSVAGNGTYLLSFPPEAEVARVTEYAASQGATQFAFLGPESAYGRRVSTAYERSARNVGGQISARETYKGNDITVMQAPAQKIAMAYGEAYKQGTTTFDAILLPEGGTALRSLAPLLTYYEGRTANALKLGTGLWNREEVSQEPALKGGVFAGPDQAAKAGFQGDYKATYNADPSRLASLAYDGINISADIAEGNPRAMTARITDPEGFYGVDGFIRFRVDGTPERGLAIYEVQSGRFDVVEPAPKTAEEMLGGVR